MPFDEDLDEQDVHALEPDEQHAHAAMDLHHRHLSDEQVQTFEEYISEIFTAFGLDLTTPATKQTPQRFLRAMFDATEGYEGDPKLLTVFETECRGGPDCRLSQVIEGPIQFFGLCEHHALPFHGQAYLGYIAHEHIIGISKLTRLVRLFAKRFTVQERIRQQRLPPSGHVSEVHGAGGLSARAILEAVSRVRQSDMILVEGGPQLMGDFFVERCLDELFLTLAPQIAGRDENTQRPGFVAGKRFAPEHPVWGTLIGVKRGGSHLFLRYAFETAEHPEMHAKELSA